ncbi:fas-binding factor 1 homolog [Strix uralensis]|uniref:fas-binding factor 1 homolog n=1 Tax=Strix uralensis TaxID=36305 RepID=UPI003DA73409
MREEVWPARAKLDELLGRGSMTRTLEEPDLGERREVKLAKEYQKQLEKEEGRHKDDFVFGAYQPTVASIAKGRPARRQPLRFSAEKNSELKAEPLSKAPLSASQSPAWGCRNRSGWLGLKREEFFDLELSSPAKASPAGSSRSPAAAGQPGPARQLLAAEEAAAKTDPVEEEEDWLSAALARKKAQAQAKAQERTAKPSEVPGEGLNPGSPVRLSPQPWACCMRGGWGLPLPSPTRMQRAVRQGSSHGPTQPVPAAGHRHWDAPGRGRQLHGAVQPAAGHAQAPGPLRGSISTSWASSPSPNPLGLPKG